MTLLQMAEMSSLQKLELNNTELEKNCKAELSAFWKSIILMGYNLIFFLPMYFCGPGSSVGIATGYGLEGSGIESR